MVPVVRPDGLDDDVFVALTHENGVRSHLWASRRQGAPGPRIRAAGTEGEGEALHRASQANAQAVCASGRTIAALAGACSLVAVPSRTRPTMPW